MMYMLKFKTISNLHIIIIIIIIIPLVLQPGPGLDHPNDYYYYYYYYPKLLNLWYSVYYQHVYINTINTYEHIPDTHYK